MIYLLLAMGVALPGDTIVYRGSQGELHVEAPRVQAPVVRVDGRLEEATWSKAAVLTGFTQYDPVEGIPASQETDVRVLYGPDAIYFGVTAHDTEPGRIRATLGERDEGVTDDDWIRISLDTFDDNAQAYVFYVNPRGVQADGLWVEGLERRGGWGPPIDFNPDFLWESAARVTETGWVAELRIPFVSLRFREAEVQEWGLNVVRQVRRTDFQSAWAPITADAANKLELSGALTGLEGLEARRLVEVNPVLTGKRTGELTESGAFVREDFEPSFGLNARYGVTRNMVLDATFNPDFSQVEADADQVAINERFALFFPEKRPFFLEGTEVFNTPQRLVYTRSIVDPVGGAKLTGKLGAFNVGYLGAVDESPVTLDLGTEGQEAAFNLVRVRRDVGSGSNVGALYTDRTLVDGSQYNRVGAVDTRLVLGGRYALTAQLAGAWSREVDDAGSPEDLFGPMFTARVERSGRIFSWQAGVEDVHPEFRARSGFIRRVGDTQIDGQVQYTFLNEPGAFLEDWGPMMELRAFYDHDDFWSGRQYHEAEMELGLDLSLRGANGGRLSVQNGYYAFDPEDYDGYEVPEAGIPAGQSWSPLGTPEPLDNLWGVQLFGRTRPAPWLSIRGRINYREIPIYAEGSRGVELLLGPTAEIRFPFGLMADASFTYSRIDRVDGDRFSLAQIPRLKVQYQFSRALFARAIVQYNLQERDALGGGNPFRIDGEVSEPVETGEMRYDFLISYEPSPGTIVYAGWSRMLEGPETYRYGQMTPVSEGLFLKISYLFRL